jgi:hypothetical protein
MTGSVHSLRVGLGKPGALALMVPGTLFLVQNFTNTWPAIPQNVAESADPHQS